MKIPFLKFKINKHTFFNTIGFIIVAASFILFLSFTQKGNILIIINAILTRSFGRVSIFFPVVTLLFGTHFFNTKKLKIIKPTVTLGSILFFFALLGFLRGGQYGLLIFSNLRQDFSLVGGLLILSITFIIGILLFFNTSVETFFLLIIHLFKYITAQIKKNSIQSSVSKKDQKKEKIREEQFIQDKKIIPAFTPSPIIKPKLTVHRPTTNQSSINIRPLSKDSQTSWIYPPITLLSSIVQKEADRGDIRTNSDIIEKTLDSFGIRARVSEVNKGPTVTQYAIEIVRGTKISKITALSNDLALALAASTGLVRIEAPIPGRSLVGIEIPNKKAEIVAFKKLLSSPEFVNNPHPLLVPLGFDVSGKPVSTSINKMPHVLIAGTTGAGKSVLLNTWICSFLFRAKPEEMRLLLVDPKRVELTLYNRIPHLLTEVIVEPEKIISALKWTVDEMDKRYKIFEQASVRNIDGYNELGTKPKMPYIILIIDELADLMVFAPSEVEGLITRIAQMARATGIHLILATQRPSVDVITGLMKANIPARIAFNVASMIDSRVVLDMPGAEKLLGKGDMLFLPPDQAKPRRIQSPFISEKDVSSTVAFLRQHSPEVHYTEEVTSQEVSLQQKRSAETSSSEKDPLFAKSLELVIQSNKASASLLQRRFSIGYNRAARILDQLESEGYISHSEGQKPREIIRRQAYDNEEVKEV